MFVKRQKLLACIILLLSIIHQHTYAEELYFRHYNNKHGLSHNTVFCSLQDKKGFMWFGTDDGLNRFDGHSFKVYRYNSYQPNNSLSHDHIINMFEDSRGKLWVLTDKSTCCYDEETDSFYSFKFPSGNTSEYFTLVTEDKRNNLWFASYDRIVRYSQSDESLGIYPAGNHFHPYCLVKTSNDEPLFASASDLYTYNQETDKFSKLSILSEKEKEEQVCISAIYEVPQLGVLIGTDKKGLKFYSYHDRNVETVIPEIQVRAITSYNNNVYWIASESGVYIYNVLSKQITNLRKSLTNEYAISDNAIYSITKDREGGMWVGSFFGGISYLPHEYVNFQHFIGGKTHPQMPGNAVREICSDEYGNIWFGTEDNGINRFNLETGEITNFSLNSPVHRLSATNIHGLLAEGNKLWVGTYNKGIEVLELPSCKKLKQYTLVNTNNGLKNDFILCFHRTKDNNLLVGTASGTVIYDRKTDSFHPWKEINALVRQIYSDSDNNIWIASSNGLFKYDPVKDAVSQYVSEINSSQTLGSNNITSVFEDSKKRIWITTVNGFSLYNKETNTFNRITVEDGLPSNIVYRILEDNEHMFWISTANGLVKFNPETHTMRVFTYTDGLHETQFNYSSSFKAADGTMYMGTINGMISFNPQYFKEDIYSPPLYITNVKIPGNKSHFPEEGKELSLPYNKSTFSLSYVALSYTSPDAIQYSYMLEGIDSDWNHMGGNTDVTFANLAPGKYVFKVKSTNSSGIWQSNEKRMQIIIIPPFWATGWAWLIYALLFVLLIALFYNYKKSKLEEKHKLEQEKFQSRKEKELYNAKIEFFTFITHEIRTPLTLIKAPLEKILKSNDGSSGTKKNLHIIERNTQRLLDLSNQLLDFRKTESKGFKLNFIRTDVTVWLDSIIQRFIPAFEKEGKKLNTRIPDNHFYGDIDREALLKITSNLLSNALKYSEKYVLLQLRIYEKDDNKFIISVINDGLLIPEEEKDKIFNAFYRLKETENIQGSGIGLSLARSLAEYHNGSLTYHQTEDGLNQFTLILPVIQSMNNEYSGELNIDIPTTLPDNNKNPLILIVEDQTDMRQFIVKELSENYQTLEAANGKIALELLKDHNVKLIVSDVMMPVMDGFDLCNEVKNNINFSHIPFIILTAQHNLQSRLRGLNNGADAYIEKPFSMELLTTQIINLLKSRELLNRSYLEKPLSSMASLAVSSMDEVFLEKFNSYIEANLLNQKLTVEMIAIQMNMSTSSLYRKIKALSGISPNDIIRIIRLKKALQLMLSGDRRINEIAFQVGFSSPAYFSTCFQKQYGKSPSEYMKDIPVKE